MKNLVNEAMPKVVPDILPIIPTMDVVVFPHIIVPLLVLDERIIQGINQSVEESKLVLLLAARDTAQQHGSIGTEDLYRVGTVGSIMRIIKVPDGGIKVLVQGLYRATVEIMHSDEQVLYGQVTAFPFEQEEDNNVPHIVNNIKALAEQMSAANGGTFSPDFHVILSKMQDTEKIADFILSHLTLKVTQAQILLESRTQHDFLEKLYTLLSKEAEISEIQEKIRNEARNSINQSQKEFYLREQLKAIKQELGEDDIEEIETMRQKLSVLPVSEEIRHEINRQINRLERTAPDSLEATVTRNHLEWIFALPWGVETEDNLDIAHAKAILDQEHYGLGDIKERILDFISVRNLKKNGFGPILCLVGPPGTGKTSLGQSIAASLGRKYARISLGGVKDEAEIRGHRRTYVGAMPGRFIQAMRKAGSCNPVLVIDELDKIGSDFRGDPSAAMLEVLDPHQNKTFYDNYLGIPFDLSKAMFIATANTIDTISEPLRDRLEIIELSGYTLEEKVSIGKKYLIKKSIHDAGLDQKPVDLSETVLTDLVMNYTRESGVRQLERLIRKLCSKVARQLVEHDTLIQVDANNIENLLGPRRFLEDIHLKNDQIGISNGLAWTAFGGEIIKIEAVLMPGKGKLTLTGQLGDVMKESAQAALSYARAHAKEFGINDCLFTKHDLHIHVPAGAVPKDGPSAGITMLTAILSALTLRPISAQYVMTGELNLRGEVMPIGGVKEKILAAVRNKVPYVILPDRNKHDLVGIENITNGIGVVLVNHANEVLNKVLLPKLEQSGRVKMK
ncbi:endopeptidase La [bacterium]|nr:MAG: endopeptidase La [bacterium]QQR62166.1 MAG: endopeptidase La [bacterium]QQR63277.1 MAG: endopeptidase La [bacterium]